MIAIQEAKPDINNFRQNHPELIVSDLAPFVDSGLVRFILKYRGINKWLRVRRLLIELKHRWRDEIKHLDSEKKVAKQNGDFVRYHKLKGYIEAMIDCRQQVRALCHSPRDIDFPQDKHNFGDGLPPDFPKRPHKRYLWRNSRR